MDFDTALKFGIKKNYLINAIDQATTGKNHPYFKILNYLYAEQNI